MPGSLVGGRFGDPEKIPGGSVHGVELVLGLVVLAVVVATLAERLRAPAPSMLALVGLGVGLVPGVPGLHVNPTLVSLAILPPLLYAGSTDVALPELRAVWRPVAILAVGLVGATAVAVAFVTHAVRPAIPLAAAFVLGAVLASTDPVAVSALARRLHLPPRLLALVQGESLLNDATSLVLFQVAVGVVAAGGGVDPLAAAGRFVRLGGGGAAVGLALAVLAEQLYRRTADPVLETVLALVIPYAVYVAAEAVGASGVTGVVVAGLRLGDRGLRLTAGPSRLQIAAIYGVIVFLLESVVFAVIGLELPSLVRQLPADEHGFVPGALAVVAVVVVTRVLWVFPVAYLPRLLPGRRRHQRDGTGSSSLRWQVPAVVSWAGTRGVVPLAAALSIPLTVHSGRPFPERDLLLVLATSCIIATLVVQGLTLAPLVRSLDVGEDPARSRHEEALARHAVALAALARLEEIADVEAAPEVVLDRLRSGLTERVTRSRLRLEETRNGDGSPGRPEGGAAPGDGGHVSTAAAYRRLRRDLLEAETAQLLRLRDEGAISETVRRKVQRSLDVEETGLRE